MVSILQLGVLAREVSYVSTVVVSNAQKNKSFFSREKHAQFVCQKFWLQNCK